jgi:hypothetical protein
MPHKNAHIPTKAVYNAIPPNAIMKEPCSAIAPKQYIKMGPSMLPPKRIVEEIHNRGGEKGNAVKLCKFDELYALEGSSPSPDTMMRSVEI